MGIFSKLRADMNHGGVKLQVQVPSSVAADQVIPVTVNLTTDTPRTINSITAELQSQAREQGIGLGGNNGISGRGVGVNQSTTNYQKVAEVKSSEPFMLNPGETKAVSLQLYLNGSATNASPMGQLGGMPGAVGSMLQGLAAARQELERVTYTYRVHVSADVADVGVGPNDNEPVQIIPPASTAPAVSMAPSVVAASPSPAVQPTAALPSNPAAVQPVAAPNAPVSSGPNQPTPPVI
jgi:hypothetical protein